MKNLLPLFCCLIISCSSPVTTEQRVQKYMTDSVVPRFNDPASYQFASMKIDTFRGRDYYENIKELYADTSLFTPGVVEEKHKELEEIEKNPRYMDSILNLQIQVDYRGKNKMGALVLNTMKLRYYPSDNRIEEMPK